MKCLRGRLDPYRRWQHYRTCILLQNDKIFCSSNFLYCRPIRCASSSVYNRNISKRKWNHLCVKKVELIRAIKPGIYSLLEGQLQYSLHRGFQECMEKKGKENERGAWMQATLVTFSCKQGLPFSREYYHSEEANLHTSTQRAPHCTSELLTARGRGALSRPLDGSEESGKCANFTLLLPVG